MDEIINTDITEMINNARAWFSDEYEKAGMSPGAARDDFYYWLDGGYNIKYTSKMKSNKVIHELIEYRDLEKLTMFKLEWS